MSASVYQATGEPARYTDTADACYVECGRWYIALGGHVAMVHAGPRTHRQSRPPAAAQRM